MMREANLTDIDFINNRNKPTIQRDGRTHEIYSIVLEDDGSISVLTIIVRPWTGLKDLTLDSTWRSNSLTKVKGIVERAVRCRKGIFG